MCGSSFMLHIFDWMIHQKPSQASDDSCVVGNDTRYIVRGNFLDFAIEGAKVSFLNMEKTTD